MPTALAPTSCTPAGVMKPPLGQSNCTICQKGGFTNLILKPDAFTLISPTSRSELPDYQPNSKDIHKYFCDKCGVQVFGEGVYVLEGKSYDHFAINLLSLDQPQEGLELSEWKFKYVDGRHDNWMGGSKDVPWEGGCL